MKKPRKKDEQSAGANEEVSMSWLWHPGAKGYEVADRAFNPAVGCSNVGCTERAVCRARRFALRQKPYCRTEGYVLGGCSSRICIAADGGLERIDESSRKTCRHYRGCQRCCDFEIHDHFERWTRFRARPGERIALAWGGDLFDRERPDSVIQEHLSRAEGWNQSKRAVFLLQTRHVNRAIRLLEWGKYADPWFQIGTSFTSPTDLDNVRALARLPEKIVRFIAVEPFWGNVLLAENLTVIQAAKPNWAYIGGQTPKRKRDFPLEQNAAGLGDYLSSIGCAVIYKRSCGPELYKRNEGVVLP